MTLFAPIMATAAAGTEVGGTAGLISSLLPFVLLILVFYFIMIRPQRKREKQTQQMRNNLQVGDEVITVGGIVGLVVSLKEDTVVVETGGDRSKIRVKRWAIQENLTVHDDPASK